MSKHPHPLQKVTSERLVISTIRVPWKGGTHLSFDLTQPLILKQGDSWAVEGCQPTKSSTVPVLDPKGEQLSFADGSLVTTTQIDTVELKFAVQRAGHRKIKTQWRYGNLQTAQATQSKNAP